MGERERERERERLGIAFSIWGWAWEPIKGVAEGRRATSCAWNLGAPARPALYVGMERGERERLRVWSVPFGRRTGLTA